MNFDIENHTILEVIHGSHAYGLAGPESDLDIRGVAIPPKDYFLGFTFHFEQYDSAKEKEDRDFVIYDIRKFFRLAANCNPNVLEILYVPEHCLRKTSQWGERLIENRQHFLSKKAKHTFSGYAISQLKRIQAHRRWLLKPPDHKPTREEFALGESSALSADIRGTMEALAEQGIQLETRFSTSAIEVWQRERAYHNALREWQQYQNWKATRNPKRAELEERYGYDCKHAMHLVRLMRMCREVLTQGEVLVERPDREELLAIRNGAWPYDQLMAWAETQDEELNVLYESCTILPRSPNVKKLDTLCMEIVESFLSQI